MIKYKLFQVKKELTRELGFMSLRMITAFKIPLDLANYELAYEGEIESKPKEVLEDLYRKFNVNHPSDFKGVSMSVSDIIEIDGKYHYCDSIGFQEVNAWLKGVKSP